MGTLHPLRPRPAPRRPADDTAFVGAVLFVASWAVLFAALLFGYGVVRLRAPVWPPLDAPAPLLWPPLVAGLALLGSSLALGRGLALGDIGQVSRGRRWVGLALVGGLGFLGLQSLGWYDLWLQGLALETSYGSILYALTGFHALHVLVTLLVLGIAAVRLGRPSAWRKAAELFWHFLGVVWGLMFLAIYVL